MSCRWPSQKGFVLSTVIGCFTTLRAYTQVMNPLTSGWVPPPTSQSLAGILALEKNHEDSKRKKRFCSQKTCFACLAYLSSIFWFHFWFWAWGMAIPFQCFGVEYSFDNTKHRLLLSSCPKQPVRCMKEIEKQKPHYWRWFKTNFPETSWDATNRILINYIFWHIICIKDVYLIIICIPVYLSHFSDHLTKVKSHRAGNTVRPQCRRWLSHGAKQGWMWVWSLLASKIKGPRFKDICRNVYVWLLCQDKMIFVK